MINRNSKREILINILNKNLEIKRPVGLEDLLPIIKFTNEFIDYVLEKLSTSYEQELIKNHPFITNDLFDNMIIKDKYKIYFSEYERIAKNEDKNKIEYPNKSFQKFQEQKKKL